MGLLFLRCGMVVVELLHLPLLGLLLQRLVHLSARSKLKNEIDPEEEKLMLTCFMCTMYISIFKNFTHSIRLTWSRHRSIQRAWECLDAWGEIGSQSPSSAGAPPEKLEIIYNLFVNILSLIETTDSHLKPQQHCSSTWAFWSWDLKRTLRATMYLLFFSRARYTFPNFPFPSGRLHNELS